MTMIFPPRAVVSAPVAGTDARFPVGRIYCVGRNYAAHAREMGSDPTAEPPFFFAKDADAVAPDGATIPYPAMTRNLHHEVELVVAIGKAGFAVDPADRARNDFRLRRWVGYDKAGTCKMTPRRAAGRGRRARTFRFQHRLA